ncbi:MAG: GNAT family N-acetyltransferase [Albidovulum sp.]|uniref:GNAT family N-acetyltransferase n=1 Tax=Albidovulum sp. TaxID=1872424 RepID=UPI003C94943A
MTSVTLTPIGRDDFDRVAGIHVTPEQERFSGTVAEAFASGETGIDFHAILQDGRAVGFFKIDRNYAQRHDSPEQDELSLRAFMIDRDMQGRGIATAAVVALSPYLARHYPGKESAVLTVNVANPAAIRCYLKGGFHDTGAVYPHGDAGPQHILRLILRMDCTRTEAG